jgi:CDP-diacylglycerol--glycerol-3-phosphate 3-phosphatidyltransferase
VFQLEDRLGGFLNWANGLTLGRLILGPVILSVLMSGREWLAFALFVVAMITDLCDGYLARRSNSVTELGKLMDPLADKVLVSLLLLAFWRMGLRYVPFWMVAVVIARELLILGCRTGVLKSGEGFVTSRAAKWKTAVQMGWVALVLLHLALMGETGFLLYSQVAGRFESVLLFVGGASVALTLLSGIEYMINGRALSMIRNGADAGKTHDGS